MWCRKIHVLCGFVSAEDRKRRTSQGGSCCEELWIPGYGHTDPGQALTYLTPPCSDGLCFYTSSPNYLAPADIFGSQLLFSWRCKLSRRNSIWVQVSTGERKEEGSKWGSPHLLEFHIHWISLSLLTIPIPFSRFLCVYWNGLDSTAAADYAAIPQIKARGKIAIPCSQTSRAQCISLDEEKTCEGPEGEGARRDVHGTTLWDSRRPGRPSSCLDITYKHLARSILGANIKQSSGGKWHGQIKWKTRKGKKLFRSTLESGAHVPKNRISNCFLPAGHYSQISYLQLPPGSIAWAKGKERKETARLLSLGSNAPRHSVLSIWLKPSSTDQPSWGRFKNKLAFCYIKAC